MICPQCRTRNLEHARFCLHCGARLILACPICHTEVPALARFCPTCGSRIDTLPSPMPRVSIGDRTQRLQRLVPREYAERLLATEGQASRERRIVTILFSDIQGSTAMAESLDPEEVMEIMDGAFELLIEPIYRYEGTLARLMGDGILAFFGAPTAHEDDPQRACLAALEIVAGAREYAARLAQERGIAGFNLRVGINTGLVVVGEVGSDLRVEYTAIGDAVNLAARLESVAEPGTVLVSEDTHKLIAPLFDTSALGRLQVKGRSGPVAVYRVSSARRVSRKVRGIAGLESPLVGREQDLDALLAVMNRLQAGAGGIVTLAGEAGIGKSRLVAELQKRVAVRGSHPEPVRWLEGRCLSYGRSMAYLLWLDLLHGLFGVTAEDVPEQVAAALREESQALCPDQFEAIFPFLAAMMSVPVEAELEVWLGRLDGRELKMGTFRAIETLLSCAASQRPLVLVLEDLHWADATSLELLEKLLPLTKQVALLFVCVFRPQRDHGSWRLWETAVHEYDPHHTGLWLEPLSADESERLVSNLLWLDHLPRQLKARILERAEGNPFYLEEILRSLIDGGAIAQEQGTGRWLATREVAGIAIPDTLQGVLQARIDALQEETRCVLQMAAVIGRLFLYRVLRAIISEEWDLDGQLLALQQEEMIRERERLPELEYIFKHQLTQEAAYNTLLKAERRVFHRQVAKTQERLFPERVDEQLGLLAYHWEQAGDGEKATDYLLRAGNQARLALAHEEAVDYYQRALACLEEMGEHDRAARTLMQLGLTFDSAFDFGRAHQAYEQGFALWQQAGGTRAPASLPVAAHALRQPWQEPVTLDPGLLHDEFSGGIAYHLFSGLVATTAETGIVPDLAASWEVSQDGRRIEFRLRDDACWSDGVPVTAYDVEYAWKRVLDPATGSRNANVLYDLQGAKAYHQGQLANPEEIGVRALDDATLTVELEAPVGYLLHLLTYPATYPVPRHVVERHGGAWVDPENLVSNGPFTLAAWHHGSSLLLERSPRYRGRFTGNVQQVELVFSTEQGRRDLDLYEADLLDTMLLPGDPAEADRLRYRYAEEYLTQPDAKIYYLAFEVARPPFDDPRVRQAFAFAVDQEALANKVLGGYVLPATGGLVPPGIAGHRAGIALPHNPQRGRQLLAEAGYPGGQGFPEVEMLLSDTPGTADIAQHLQAQWRENLGLEILWQRLPWAEFAGRVRGDRPELIFVGWMPDYPDPDNYLRVAVQLHTAWTHEPYLALVDQASRVLDQEKRIALYAQAEQILREQVPILPPYYHREHRLVKPWLTRYPISVRGWVFWKDVVIEPH